MTDRIIIADDHPLVRSAIRSVVERVWTDCAVTEVADAASARREAQTGTVELMVLDLHMADSHGLSGLLDMRQDFPAMPVVVISASEEPRVWHSARQIGASGFIPKSADLGQMQQALQAVHEGDVWFPVATDEVAEDPDLARLARLTPAQRRILALVARGLLNKQIAHEMGISEATVKAHVTGIFRRLGVINRTQAVLFAQKLDVVPPDQTPDHTEAGPDA